MIPGLFVKTEEGEEIDEYDPELAFKVEEMMLLGILYCRAQPRKRINKLYSLLQSGLDDQISASDRDIERFVPLMGKICYIAMISFYNED